MLKSSVAVAAVLAIMAPVWAASAQTTDGNTQGQAGAEVDVKTQAPEVTVEVPQPRITVEVPEPKITVEVPEPKVTVEQGEPKITIEQQEPRVTVEQAEPDVTVRQARPEAEVRESSEAQGEVESSGTAGRTAASAEMEEQLRRVQQAVTDQDRDQALESLTLVRQQVEQRSQSGEQDQQWSQVSDQLDRARTAIMDENWRHADQVLNDVMGPIRQQQAAAGRTDRLRDETTGPGTDIDVETRAEADAGSEVTVSDSDTAGTGSDPTMDNPIFAMRAEELIGRDVVDAEGKDIGDVDNVVIGRGDGTPYAIVEFGGFIGIGAKQVALPLDHLTVVSDGSVLLRSENPQELLDQFPEYNEDEYSEIAANVRVRDVMMQ